MKALPGQVAKASTRLVSEKQVPAKHRNFRVSSIAINRDACHGVGIRKMKKKETFDVSSIPMGGQLSEARA